MSGLASPGAPETSAKPTAQGWPWQRAPAGVTDVDEATWYALSSLPGAPLPPLDEWLAYMRGSRRRDALEHGRPILGVEPGSPESLALLRKAGEVIRWAHARLDELERPAPVRLRRSLVRRLT